MVQWRQRSVGFGPKKMITGLQQLVRIKYWTRSSRQPHNVNIQGSPLYLSEKSTPVVKLKKRKTILFGMVGSPLLRNKQTSSSGRHQHFLDPRNISVSPPGPVLRISILVWSGLVWSGLVCTWLGTRPIVSPASCLACHQLGSQPFTTWSNPNHFLWPRDGICLWEELPSGVNVWQKITDQRGPLVFR